MIKIEEIINISSYFSIIAHTPGRLRVRVNPKIVNEAQNISLDDITNLPKKISGIEDIKINKIIASVTIIYNPTIFKPKLWEDLIKNENLDEMTWESTTADFEKFQLLLSGWGIIELFAAVPRLPVFFVFPIWCVGLMVGQIVNRLTMGGDAGGCP